MSLGAENTESQKIDSRSISRDRFRPTREAEARLLLLIDAFSRKSNGAPRFLEGRVKLAKLDFLLRYPDYLQRILIAHGARPADVETIDSGEAPLDSRMMRYRYGPWDPSYYAVLGSLIGRGLVDVTPLSGSTGFGYRTSDRGCELAANLRDDEIFSRTSNRLKLLRRYLDLSGTTLKRYVYELPEITDATWHEEL